MMERIVQLGGVKMRQLGRVVHPTKEIRQVYKKTKHDGLVFVPNRTADRADRQVGH